MKRYRWLTIACVAGFVAVAASRADDPALPYEESWESYAPGFSPIGTNGWYGDTNHCVVTNMPYTWEAGRPIAGGSPTNVLNFDTENGAITNVFTSSQDNHYETVDTMVQLVASEDEDAARLVITNDASIKTAYYLNTNGRLVVYCSLYDGGANFTNGFWVLDDVVDTVESGDWARVSIEFDFLSDDDSFRQFFRISLNGVVYSNAVAFVNPSQYHIEKDDPLDYVGTWFLVANPTTANNVYLSSVSIHGTGHLDDYVVQAGLLAQMRTIMASVNDVRGGKYWTADSGGSEVPGSFQIADGGSTSIWLIAEPHWLVDSITTNTVALDPPYARTNEITLANVGGDITVYAELVAETTEVATGTNVPNWWLAGYFPDTNDFSEVVHYDDGDGMEAWEEYFAGTIPTNALSFFAMDTFGDSGTGWTVTWKCDVADTNLPDYIVQRATNLLEADPWTDLEPTVARALGRLSYTDTNPPVADQVFYRIFAPIPE
jgi:hypothetical protein